MYLKTIESIKNKDAEKRVGLLHACISSLYVVLLGNKKLLIFLQLGINEMFSVKRAIWMKGRIHIKITCSKTLKM